MSLDWFRVWIGDCHIVHRFPLESKRFDRQWVNKAAVQSRCSRKSATQHPVYGLGRWTVADFYDERKSSVEFQARLLRLRPFSSYDWRFRAVFSQICEMVRDFPRDFGGNSANIVTSSRTWVSQHTQTHFIKANFLIDGKTELRSKCCAFFFSIEIISEMRSVFSPYLILKKVFNSDF